MATPTVRAASFGEILLACKARILEAFVELDIDLDEAQVKIIARNASTIPRWTGTKDILLKSLNFVSRQEVFDGAGNHCVWLKRWLDLTVRDRDYLDEAQSDVSFLTNEDAIGHFDWEETAACALITSADGPGFGFFPSDSDGNHLTVQELRIYDGTAAEKDQEAREWGSSSIRFEIEYLAMLGGTR